MKISNTPAANSEARSFRPEIQGLRAVAVLAVLIFHIWPLALPGGYVGVDVFFVISGFLITSLLLREAEETGGISIAAFYERRIRRLLPAATLVLVTVGLCIDLLPEVRWSETAFGIGASALYVQNWWLADRAVDYLASENAPNVVLHFWTLSVEEQYYLVWPLLFLAATTVINWARTRPRLAFGWMVGCIGVASLAYSVYLTPRNPGLAYFATTTRAWELALGGMLAVSTGWRYMPSRLRSVLGVLGIFSIAAACWSYGATTAFPGYAALLPTVGAALVIIAGRTEAYWSADRLLGTAPFQYLGDISYSLYLWHWPVIIYFGQLTGRKISFLDGLVILAVSCLLAHLTKMLIEDPFRKAGRHSARSRSYILAALCVVASLVVAAGILIRIDLAKASGSGKVDGIEFKPSLLDARAENSVVYKLGCHVDQRTGQPSVCHFGPEDATVRIAVVGDSHAAQWVPAFQQIVENRGWRVSTYTKSACAFADLTVVSGSTKSEPYRSCDEWNRHMVNALRSSQPTLVVVTQSIGHRAFGFSNRNDSDLAIADGLIRTWSQLERADIPVLAIRDTPHLGIDVPECLGMSNATFEGCGKSSSVVLARPDPIVMATKLHPSVDLVDFSSEVCPGKACPPIIDGMLVWRDSHHMTATFAESLSPELEAALVNRIHELPQNAH